MPTYKCNTCPAEFKTQKGLDNHKCRWICPQCGKKLLTLKGYEKHINSHQAKKREEEKAQLSQQQKTDALAQQYHTLKQLGLFSPAFNPGDKVFVSSYIVTKPTHQLRFNRMVRVRYEEERRYDAFTWTIHQVVQPTTADLWRVQQCIQHNQQYPISYLTANQKTIKQSDIFPTLDQAKEDSRQKAAKYKEACDFAASCR